MSNPGSVEAIIEMVRDPSLIVTEGDEFPIQPAIKLRNKQNSMPIPGVGCIAYLKGKNNDIYPRGYRFSLYSKKIF